MKAKGQLRHRFDGIAYTSDLALAFATAADAAAALAILGDPWRIAPAEDRALLAHRLTAADVDAFEARWGKAIKISPCGFRHCGKTCKARTIDAVTHSIDFGPAFEIDLATSTPAAAATADRSADLD
jgi:hypothetical protein